MNYNGRANGLGKFFKEEKKGAVKFCKNSHGKETYKELEKEIAELNKQKKKRAKS